MKRNERQLGLVSPRGALLQALSGGEGFGMELMARVMRRTGDRVILRDGSVYPILREMEAEGLIAGREDTAAPSAAGGRPRRYWRLTAKGQKAAQENAQAIAGLFGAAAVRAPLMDQEVIDAMDRLVKLVCSAEILPGDASYNRLCETSWYGVRCYVADYASRARAANPRVFSRVQTKPKKKARR